LIYYFIFHLLFYFLFSLRWRFICLIFWTSDISTLLQCYAGQIGSQLTTFRNKLSVLYPVLTSQKIEDLIYSSAEARNPAKLHLLHWPVFHSSEIHKPLCLERD
jgi:hypothetical protein